MKIACVGGGPGGLFFAILIKARMPDAEVVVHERNPRGDTYGFGIVFSDETLTNLAEADGPTVAAIEAEFRYWSAMDVRFKGRSITSDGHGFAAMPRLRMPQILTARALDLGVDVRFDTNITDLEQLSDADLIVAADGANSGVRTSLAEYFKPSILLSSTRYIWTATQAPFDRFTFIFEESEHGWIQAHVYPYDESLSTFIVEMADTTWQAAGLAGHDADLAIGESDLHGISFVERVFADHLGDHGLIGHNSKWQTFPRIACENWSHGNVVLLGDAAQTAHYSIGSGTKLALEDAISLADAIDSHDDLTVALKAFEEARRPEVESLQRAAATSEDWFQQVDRHAQLPFEQFAFSLLTRSQRVTYDNLRERDPDYVDETRRWFASSRPDSQKPASPDTPPIF
ncbi:MAG: FAD-dependent monooxygenase, partial [Acidimicrobiales bacterium]